MAQTNLYHNDQYRPRLCHLRRRADFPGYGFNLHCDKNTFGQYIGKVDRNSPAEAAGLRENDRIIEVNYVSVENESHKEVVARIKEGVTRNNTKYPDEVILLVVDQQTDEFYDKRNLPITHSDPNVQRIGVDNDDDDHPPMLSPSASVMTDEYRNVASFTGPTVTNSFSPDSPSGRAAPPSYHDEEENEYLAIGPTLNGNEDRFAEPTAAINSSTTYMNTSASRAAPSPIVNGKSVASPLNMTAAEYRETLKEKGSKKRSVKRNSNMSMKDKIDFLNNWEKK